MVTVTPCCQRAEQHVVELQNGLVFRFPEDDSPHWSRVQAPVLREPIVDDFLKLVERLPGLAPVQVAVNDVIPSVKSADFHDELVDELAEADLRAAGVEPPVIEHRGVHRQAVKMHDVSRTLAEEHIAVFPVDLQLRLADFPPLHCAESSMSYLHVAEHVTHALEVPLCNRDAAQEHIFAFRLTALVSVEVQY